MSRQAAGLRSGGKKRQRKEVSIFVKKGWCAMGAWFPPKKDFESGDERKLESLFNEAVSYGAVLAIMHFDVHGKEKEAVRDSLVEFLSRLSKEQGVLYSKVEIDEAIGGEEEGFSTNAEVKILADNFGTMLLLSMRYGPVAVEIVKPTEIKLGAQEMQDLLLVGSEVSKQYAAYVVQKVWGAEELEKYRDRVTRQLQEGRKLREKAEGNPNQQGKEQPK